jgi:hypothetical protein
VATADLSALSPVADEAAPVADKSAADSLGDCQVHNELRAYGIQQDFLKVHHVVLV